MYLLLAIFLIDANHAFPNAKRTPLNIERKCPCNLSSLWLDIVVAIDTSKGMTDEGVTQVIADVATVFHDVPISQEIGQYSRVGIITYASEANAKFNLTDLKSNEDLMENIWDVEAEKDPISNLRVGLIMAGEVLKHGRKDRNRDNVKQLIVIYASDFREGDVNDAKQLANQLKISGVDIIAVAFHQGGKVNALDGLVDIASPRFFFKSTTANLTKEIRNALCQSNCFCGKQWTQYANSFDNSTIKYGECLRLGEIDANWVAAKYACGKLASGGHLATEFDFAKHIFNAQMIINDKTASPPYMYHIGLSYNKADELYFWEQPKNKIHVPLTKSHYQAWDHGYPNPKSTTGCVISVQTENTSEFAWRNEDCLKFSERYLCQVPSCDTDNYCGF